MATALRQKLKVCTNSANTRNFRQPARMTISGLNSRTSLRLNMRMKKRKQNSEEIRENTPFKRQKWLRIKRKAERASYHPNGKSENEHGKYEFRERGTEKVWPAQLVFIAIGFEGTEQPLLKQFGVNSVNNKISAAYGDYQTNIDGVFAAGMQEEAKA